ncbi:lantibiotic dehydratase C-terminal domain-containing protein [Psychrobacillus sp. FSL H8-0510]|uniref:lantibiotic dehydratase C-terminal domain-containing protein n=1 Tax=Psychrobacillus sp. FSL H8-0510 TaxID=2921394 RepID=UPI0030F624A1
MILIKTWESLHIYYQETENYEFILTNLVSKINEILLKENVITGFFFIRYWEKGNHLRIRFQFNEQNVKETWKDLIIKYTSTFLEKNPSSEKVINRENYYKMQRKENREGKYEQLNNVALWEEYQPETIRFCGIKGIEISESFFCFSSEQIMLMFQENKSFKHEGKLLYGIVLTYLKIKNLNNILKRNSMASLFFEYAENRRIFLDIPLITWEIIKQKSVDNSYLYKNTIDNFEENIGWKSNFYEIDKEIHKVLRNINVICPTPEKLIKLCYSYIHLNNNRLGLDPFLELYISLILFNLFK